MWLLRSRLKHKQIVKKRINTQILHKQPERRIVLIDAESYLGVLVLGQAHTLIQSDGITVKKNICR